MPIKVVLQTPIKFSKNEVVVLWETSTKNVEIGKILVMAVASKHQFLVN